jgi:hypothetical protein
MDRVSRWWRTFAVLPALLAGAAGGAAEVRVGGVRLEVPEGWREQAAADAGASDRLWILGPAAAPAASLLVTSSPAATEVSPRRLAAGRLEVERSLREAGAGIEVSAIGIRSSRDATAYEIAATSQRGTGAVRHLQYLLAGRGAVAVTLSAPAACFESLRPELERIALSLTVEEGPDPRDAAPPWLCGAVLMLLLGASAAPRAWPGRLFG